jgi:beta-lactamase regulating signal transducer with metallopeptidase domain
VGFLCLISAALGCALWSGAALRGLAAAVRSFRLTRGHRTEGSEIEPRLHVVESPARLFALSGILQPRIMVSRSVMNALSPEQFDAALRHERAHLAARDNLKRLLLLAAPGMPPGFDGFRALDRHWALFAEFAADDLAVAGDPRRSLSLASALVRVARLGQAPPLPEASTGFVGPGCHLAERVERLLHAEPSVARRRRPAIAFPACAVGALGALSLLLGPAALRGVHTLIETLVH